MGNECDMGLQDLLLSWVTPSVLPLPLITCAQTGERKVALTWLTTCRTASYRAPTCFHRPLAWWLSNLQRSRSMALVLYA
jgi:hypothetical protein